MELTYYQGHPTLPCVSTHQANSIKQTMKQHHIIIICPNYHAANFHIVCHNPANNPVINQRRTLPYRKQEKPKQHSKYFSNLTTTSYSASPGGHATAGLPAKSFKYKDFVRHGHDHDNFKMTNHDNITNVHMIKIKPTCCIDWGNALYP